MEILYLLKFLFFTLEQLTFEKGRSQQDIEDEIDQKFSSAWNSAIGTKTSKEYTDDDTEDIQVSKVPNNSYLDDPVGLGSKKVNAATSPTIPRLVIRSDIFV